MPDISSPISFDQTFLDLINAKLSSATFTHQSWGEDDLQSLRSIIRSFYRTKQRGKCAYCRKQLSLQSASNCHVEHIVPKSLYLQFIFNPKNLCVVCADCNQIKRQQETLHEIPNTLNNPAGRIQYPRSSSAFKIIHPHFDNYEEHIIVLDDMFYINRTPKGHFTIGACNLNRFVEMFGWEQNFTDDVRLSQIMNEYLSATDSVVKKTKLKVLKKLLILS